MSKHQCYKFKEVLDEVLVDEYSNFDPDFADSSSNSSEKVRAKPVGKIERKHQTIFKLISMLQIHNLRYSSDTSNVSFFVFQ